MTSPSARVRESAEFIASRAEHVRLDPAGLEGTAVLLSSELLSLSSRESEPPSADLDPSGTEEQRADWVFLISALNFCFWVPGGGLYRVRFRGRFYSGYRAFCAAVSRAVAAGVPLYRPSFYARLSDGELRELLRGEEGEIPLCPLRAQILREVGAELCAAGGSVLPLVLSCEGSGQRLVSEVLERFPSFRDDARSAHDPARRVCFYKRAQILVADLWHHFGGEGPGRFGDIGELTMFPDYRVPQVLQSLGALRYSPALLGDLTAGRELEAGGRMEQELRGVSVRCVDTLLELVMRRLGEEGQETARRNGWQLSCVNLDYFLWRYSKRDTVVLTLPHHRTVTTFY